MSSKFKPSFESSTDKYLEASQKILQPAPRALDYVKQAKTVEKEGNNLQGNFDDEVEIAKVVPPSRQTSNVNTSTKKRNPKVTPAIYMGKRAKKTATCLLHLTKVTSQLTDEEKWKNLKSSQPSSIIKKNFATVKLNVSLLLRQQQMLLLAHLQALIVRCSIPS